MSPIVDQLLFCLAIAASVNILSPTGNANLRSVNKWLLANFPRSLQYIKSAYLYLAWPSGDVLSFLLFDKLTRRFIVQSSVLIKWGSLFVSNGVSGVGPLKNNP